MQGHVGLEDERSWLGQEGALRQKRDGVASPVSLVCVCVCVCVCVSIGARSAPARRPVLYAFAEERSLRRVSQGLLVPAV